MRRPTFQIWMWLVATAAAAFASTAPADAPRPPDTPPADTRPADPHDLAAFRQDCAARAKAADDAGTMAVVGRDGWLFFADELRHLAVGRFWGADAVRANPVARPEYADPLPAIVDFKDQLEKA